MDRYFSYDPDADEFTRHATAEEARKAAESALSEYRSMAPSDGWPEEASGICWGEVWQTATVCNVRRKEDDPENWQHIHWDEVYDMELMDANNGEGREG